MIRIFKSKNDGVYSRPFVYKETSLDIQGFRQSYTYFYTTRTFLFCIQNTYSVRKVKKVTRNKYIWNAFRIFRTNLFEWIHPLWYRHDKIRSYVRHRPSWINSLKCVRLSQVRLYYIFLFGTYRMSEFKLYFFVVRRMRSAYQKFIRFNIVIFT